uniref:Uncharacterized protein n=1 Tax=Glossina austeni TaxID=7395 RepID=A0A1A9UD33_GLOAU
MAAETTKKASRVFPITPNIPLTMINMHLKAMFAGFWVVSTGLHCLDMVAFYGGLPIRRSVNKPPTFDSDSTNECLPRKTPVPVQQNIPGNNGFISSTIIHPSRNRRIIFSLHGNVFVEATRLRVEFYSSALTAIID